MARLVEVVATGRHPDATPAWQLQHYSGDLGQRPGASSSALVMPSIAAMAWRSKRRGAALAGWLVWILTLAFALSAGIGFASINISDTLTARASRTAPAVTALKRPSVTRWPRAIGNAEAVLAGTAGSASRRLSTGGRHWTPPCRPCAGGGPAGRGGRQARLMVTAGAISPSENDFSMLRLALLCLLP